MTRGTATGGIASRSSRKRGLAELVENRVLSVRVQESIDLSTFRRVRRNVYKVSKIYRQDKAWVDPATEQEAKPAKSSTVSSTTDVQRRRGTRGRGSSKREET